MQEERKKRKLKVSAEKRKMSTTSKYFFLFNIKYLFIFEVYYNFGLCHSVVKVLSFTKLYFNRVATPKIKNLDAKYQSSNILKLFMLASIFFSSGRFSLLRFVTKNEHNIYVATVRMN